MNKYDFIIVGSGPAGVSAAVPLVEAGFKVLMVDGGTTSTENYPQLSFLNERKSNVFQWKWMVGEGFYALKNGQAVSPKLRVPTYEYVFQDFNARNKIFGQHFNAIGSLATGGLSNAWGCGVATFSADEMVSYPFELSEILPSYANIAKRIGISGSINDDMSSFFGLDHLASPAIQADRMQSYIYDQYEKASKHNKVIFGRSRVAVLNEDRQGRKKCSKLGNCLWGCKNGALYTATYDVSYLRAFSNFTLISNFLVSQVEKTAQGILLLSEERTEQLLADKVLLAAGSLATTRITMKSLKLTSGIFIHSCPTAAFILLLPKFLGKKPEDSFGLGQYSFALSLADGVNAFGSLFSSNGIARSEFIKYMPFPKAFSIRIIQKLMSACVVANVFLPGGLSKSECTINSNGTMQVCGSHDDRVVSLFSECKKILRKFFNKMHAFMLPMSFKTSSPGSCIHYAASFPMHENPVMGQTSKYGEVFGFPDLYIVDGACLSSLPAKSHTLTIMANADRIACHFVKISK